MAERNYLNVNEVYPILDLINRKINQGKGVNHYYSPLLNDERLFDTSQWQVETFEVIRDTENAIDPLIIKEIVIIYRNGAVDSIILTRGLTPPVDSTVPDYEYINNLMIVGVTIHTVWMDREQTVTAKVIKDNGYGNFRKIELIYDDEGWLPDVEDIDKEVAEDYDNPHDFYDGVSDSGYDEEVDTAEDYAGYGYTESDSPRMPSSGWADGFNPSDPIDVDVE